MTTLRLTHATIVVVKVTDSHANITQEQAAEITRQVQHACGPNQKVLILPYGLSIEKLTLEEVT